MHAAVVIGIMVIVGAILLFIAGKQLFRYGKKYYYSTRSRLKTTNAEWNVKERSTKGYYEVFLDKYGEDDVVIGQISQRLQNWEYVEELESLRSEAFSKAYAMNTRTA